MFEVSLLKYSLEAAQIYRRGEKNSIACLHTKLFVKKFYLAVYHEREDCQEGRETFCCQK